MNYCNFRLSAYELEMDLMENRVKTDKGDLYKPTELSYCRDTNFQQSQIFHDTKPVTSRLDKLLKLAHLDNLNDKEFESIYQVRWDPAKRCYQVAPQLIFCRLHSNATILQFCGFAWNDRFSDRDAGIG